MKYAWMCQCQDADDVAGLRQDLLAQHLEYIESVLDRLLVGGALYDEAGDMAGSCLVYDVQSRDEAVRLMENDPYFQAGIWRRVEYSRWRLAAGEWAGGMPLAAMVESPES